MYLLVVLLLAVVFLVTFWMGYQRLLRLQHLNQQRLLYGLLAAMILLTLMTAAHRLGYFPQKIAANVTMGLYTAVAGFFFGYALKQFILRRQSGAMEYAHRSFWTEAIPNLISILLIAFGLYRMHLFTLGPFTGIGLTSGLSLLAFGIMGLTIRVVPEFRQKGILILDQQVPWQEVVAYRWYDEQAIQIDYLTPKGNLTDFVTAVPEEDHLFIERLLGKKLKEHEEERKEKLAKINKAS
ncbi:hypothetical protein [Fodinibius sediminis]|uniref:DUF5673 domain-containing protein n=1 Tax=Fodinibius sediminis TaxID=1214077 RepID=A0A521E5N7_9BACT|nr:hypothetical protein [Fodinibius sediminis]SMO78470.1 hypothetical protein SAMN06265218_11321 [Fodinibius sediminis]